jgi:hypothetical protein
MPSSRSSRSAQQNQGRLRQSHRNSSNDVYCAVRCFRCVRFRPVPDPEDFSRMDSNLRYISVSIRIVFQDAHAAKTVVDKAVQEAAGFPRPCSQKFGGMNSPHSSMP